MLVSGRVVGNHLEIMVLTGMSGCRKLVTIVSKLDYFTYVWDVKNLFI